MLSSEELYSAVMKGGIKVRYRGINMDAFGDVFVTKPKVFEPYEAVMMTEPIEAVSESGKTITIPLGDIAHILGLYRSEWELADT